MDLSVLIVGKGGREHMLAWKISQSPKVAAVFVLPGNGGTAQLAKCRNICDVAAHDYPAVVSVAKRLGIGLVVVGPDDVVVDGIEGHFRDSGILCFAPTKEAAELEDSKTFAKEFVRRHGIPTARFRSFDDYAAAREYLLSYLLSVPQRVVIKVFGLAAGKGVVLPASEEEGLDALREIMADRKFGDAGSSVVIEEFLEGDEISVHTFSDSKVFRSLPPGQDHKRIFDDNRGPNTGGKGVYAPTDFVSAQMMDEIDRTVLKPTFYAMKAEGKRRREFIGMLFTGIMITAAGPKVIEYNVRFGDPETQSMIPLLSDDTDLVGVLQACLSSSLETVTIRSKPGYACNVVVVAGGYPESYRQGDLIGIGESTDVHFFHAGTKLVDGELRSAGGRVLSVAAVRGTLKAAVDAAYEGVRSVRFDDLYYRKDIVGKALFKQV